MKANVEAKMKANVEANVEAKMKANVEANVNVILNVDATVIFLNPLDLTQ
jgi:hypothetical protein